MLDFAEIIAEIDTIAVSKQTGVLFIISDNRLTQLHFHNGEITSLSYKRQSGIDVLDHIKKISRAKVGFHENKEAKRDDSLPETGTIIKTLREDLSAEELDRSFFRMKVAPDLLARIKAAYIEVIGPAGGMLFDKSLTEVRCVATLVESLASQMGSIKEVDEFNQRLDFL